MTRTALKCVGRLEYIAVRTPLQIVDDQVVRRYLGEESTVRRIFEHALGAYDQAAATWRPGSSTDDGPVESAFDRVAPETTVDPVADAPVEPDAGQVEELAEELLDEQETDTFVGELAENDDLRQVQAELQAKRLLEEQGE